MSKGEKKKKDPGAGDSEPVKQSAGAPAGATEPQDLYETRLEKLRSLLADGRNPYLSSFARSAVAGDLLKVAETEYSEESRFRVAGRLRSRRLMGKAGFLDLEDESGRIQLYGAKNSLGDSFELFKTLDIGDIVGVEGFLFKTKTGQTSLNLNSIQLLAKCLQPLPAVKEVDGKTYYAFSDKEQRYRRRYVDLIVNPDVRETFRIRSRIVAHIRNYLSERDFLEVETPMMHPIPGGATARPFVTHHNTLDMDLFLRIAPELYLKRLLVGGFAKVFELNRNFRNEGISYKHNPEFTMLELYEAYGDMNSMLTLCEDLIVSTSRLVTGGTVVEYEGHRIDLTPPWTQMTFVEVIEKHSGARFRADMELEEARQEAVRAGLSKEQLADLGSVWRIAEAVFDAKVEEFLVQPIFVTHFPRELSPLAKTWRQNTEFVERFEPYIAGREMGNAFSELNDPIDQKQRFEDQVAQRESGAGEGGYMDLDYVRALEYGMPPAGGMGIGIDRLVMLLTGQHSIRDTILFPQLRAEKS